jgi:ribosomal-protein-alanine N-acetyltransferase
MSTLQTLRLVLRPWRDDDRAAFAAMNADPEVMKHFHATLTPAQSDEAADRMCAHIAEHGWGFWAVEVPGVAPFVGIVGLMSQRFALPGGETDWVEIGWRLARPHWGHGYAQEAAHASVDFAFRALKRPDIVAFTVPENRRSRRVMDRLGMVHDPQGDFDHPMVPETSPKRRHVLYRLTRAHWEELHILS